MAVENVNSKPIAASAAIADFILASIGGKVRRVPISTLAETLTDAEVELISAAASALVSAAGRACYIGENENWYVWDGAQGRICRFRLSIARHAGQSWRNLYATRDRRRYSELDERRRSSESGAREPARTRGRCNFVQ